MNENLLLVPALDVEKWPNDLHIQFNQTQDECAAAQKSYKS
jgi:hypothetical protein